MEPKELNMKNYLYISQYYRNKVLYFADRKPVHISPRVPKLIAVDEHNDIVILTKSKLDKEIFDNLYEIALDRCDYSPCFSFEKGKETDLAFQLGIFKYVFAFMDNTFKYYNRQLEKWCDVHYFCDDLDWANAFLTLAQKGSFVLGLDKSLVEDFFDPDDVFNNN